VAYKRKLSDEELLEFRLKHNLKGFEPGKSGNPKGRPKGSKNRTTELMSALKKAEKERGISLIQHAVNKAYTNTQVLIAVLKKIIPDMEMSDIKLTPVYETYESMSDEELLREASEVIASVKSISTSEVNKDNSIPTKA